MNKEESKQIIIATTKIDALHERFDYIEKRLDKLEDKSWVMWGKLAAVSGTVAVCITILGKAVGL